MGCASCASAFLAMKVKVTIPKTQEAMVVPRRYRDFEALRNDLVTEFPMVFDKKQNPDAPDLPPKQFFGNMAPDVIAGRRAKLEEFLQACLQFEEVLKESVKFGKFLQLDG